MKMKSLCSCLRLGAVFVLVWTTAAASPDDSSVIRLVLQNTGIEPAAAGTALATLKSKGSLLSVNATGLTPGHNYSLTVGDVPEAALTADARGRASVQFKSPPKKKTPVLDFDPRGQLLAIRDGTNSLLEAVFSGASEPSVITVDERVRLTPLAGGTGVASARYLALKNGARTFAVNLRKITGTNWSLYVNGIFRGDIPVKKSSGTLTFKSNPGTSTALLLDFDPRGQVLDIVQDTNLIFSGQFEAQIKNVNVASPSVQESLIASTGADPDGTASARLRMDADARRSFSVELEDVPVGAYEFLADGVLLGSINVTTHTSGTKGEIEFSNRADSGDELPLTFDPTNTTLTVQQGATIFFQGTLTFGSAGGTNDAPALMDEALTSTGLDPDASGDAKFEIDNQGRHKFSVEIEDVVAGAYQVWVGGVQRGTIKAQLASTKVKGQVEFSNPTDAGKLALNFDPRGQLIEVKTAAGVFFSHLFGLADTNSTIVLPLRIELPLFNLGIATNASANMKFMRDDRGRRSFQVEIEDAPAGSYDLLVGGSQKVSIPVTTTASGTRGQVEFKDESSGGNQLLDFDPLGQDVTIRQNGNVYFERTLPADN